VKRVKKETPAKIIQMPVAPKVAKPARKKAAEPKPEEKRKKAPSLKVEKAPPTVLPEKEKKGKKRKKSAEEEIPDRKFFKKKISFKKKAVVEGADLYTPGYRKGRKGRKPSRVKMEKGLKPVITVPKAIKRRIKIDETIILSDLAKRMGIKAHEIIGKLMGLGVMATVTQAVDFDTAVLVAAEFDYELEKASFEEETVLKLEQDDPGKLSPRPPVVTIMGHVDHGKTSLLDKIRETRVTEMEAGGITQHIGAYHVNTGKGQIVFLDTPGHEAFTAMRARGAKVTDIVVLVVAADDGVMPQTIEAINHSRVAKVPIIVAVNKIDKANAEPDRVMRELAEENLTPEDWGGDTIFVQVSAKMGEGVDDLLEMIILQAELLELKANADKLAKGYVVEAQLDSGRGPLATVLVKEGTLKAGDSVVCGIHYGKVRALLNDRGQRLTSASPSIPVEIDGLSGVPMAGDEFAALADEKDAKQISNHRIQKHRSNELARGSRVSLENLYEQIQEGEVKDLNLIIKADVHGSIEALRDSLSKLSNEEVKINVIQSGTGTITESEISLASVSNAIIVGFNVRPGAKFVALAAEEQVEMHFYNVIYDVIKDIKDAIVGMMSSTFEERVLGMAEVRETFHIPRMGTIAGCYVSDGRLERGQHGRLIRDGVVIYDSTIASLRRFKDDAKEVVSGYECGVGIENYNDIKIGDTIECYDIDEIKPEIK
ncbi:MAG: translation initiation factor IF-2, partial [Desulfobacterales bacterium]